MNRPAGCEIAFIFVENDGTSSLGEYIDTFRSRVSEEVTYALEPTAGIPVARNSVLDLAIRQQADLLTFVDDDEVVSVNWLPEIVQDLCARSLDLVGGPVYPIAEFPQSLTDWNNAVLAFLQKRASRRIRTRAKAVTDGTDRTLNIYTNNWIVRLSAIERLSVRFDEALRFCGGSDTKFCMDLRRAGGQTGWVTGAEVYDVVPKSRLNVRYTFRRARDQAINAAILNEKTLGRALGFAAMRVLEAIAITLTVPVTGRVHAIRAVFKLGQAVGRVMGVTGGRSRHYQTSSTSGNCPRTSA